MTDISNLIAIGQFSSLTRLSVRMLRHYDANGVLVPAQVDATTGYRRYAATQLADAMLVRQLRDVGFGVPAIGALLAARDTSTFTRALDQQRAVLVDETRAAQHRLTLIDQMRQAHRLENTMSITIDQHTFAARRIIGLRDTIPTYGDEGQLWGRFMPALQSQGIDITGLGGAINHDDGFKESDVDTEVWLEVADGTTAQDPLSVRDLPEQPALRATLVGPYDQIGEACDRLARRAADENLTMTGGMHYVYLNDPSSTAPEELRTEIYLPIA
ncbi:MAG: MerR family transcriptional regulator [Propionibacteriales bacterium]|nr:MerR family transcriptional regulator [Propionibacteriales bacterium]